MRRKRKLSLSSTDIFAITSKGSFAFARNIGLGVLVLIAGIAWLSPQAGVIDPVLSRLYFASAADSANDMLVYRGGGDSSIPEYKLRNNSGFGSEGTAQDITSPIQYIKVVANPNGTDEKVLCTKDSGNDVNCQVWDGSAWDDLIQTSPNAGARRAMDIAYEQSSGDAMVCYRHNSDTSVPNCDIWNGTDWNTSADASDVTSPITTMKLIPDPNSDEIALITKDTADDINVQIWSGSAWGNLQEVETNAGNCDRCFPYDGAWEESGHFVVAWFSDADDEVESREFTTSWQSQVDSVITGLSTTDIVHIRADGNPDTDNDQILIAVADDDDTLTANEWDGSAWGTQQELSTAFGTVADDNHLFFLAFEQTGDYDALLSYGSATNDIQYRVWDSDTDTWGSESTLPTAVEAKNWHQLASDPNGEAIMLTTLGATNDVDTIEWDGSSFDGSWTSHESAGETLFWNAWFTYDYEVETTPPTGSINSAAQKTNGSGLVDISIEVDDSGDADTRARLEYDTNASCDGPWNDATLDESGGASADFDDSGGSPSVENDDTYQVGTAATRRIITSSGSNTVLFDWDAATDAPSTDAIYCLRLTVNNDTEDSVVDMLTVAIDTDAPTITSTDAEPQTGIIEPGDDVDVTLTAGGAETGLSVGTCTVNGVDVSGTFVDNLDGTYDLTYAASQGDGNWSSGNLSITCNLSDSFGNTGMTTAFNDGNTLQGALGGSGGGGISCNKPSIQYFALQDEASVTSERRVSFTLRQQNGFEALLSEQAGFVEARTHAVEAGENEGSFALSAGDGLKTVHLIVRNACGWSLSISDTIEYIAPPPPPPPAPVLPKPEPEPSEPFPDLPPGIEPGEEADDEVLSAPRAGVTVYEHINYEGESETFFLDDEDDDLRGSEMGQDIISSIRVFGTVVVKLFEHIFFGGVLEIFIADDPDLRDNRIGNDRVSSIQVTSGQASANKKCIASGTFTRFLIVGSLGQEVRELQTLLQCLGYFPDNRRPTGFFGPVTEAAVQAFQVDHAIENVGWVGPKTRAALNGYIDITID